MARTDTGRDTEFAEWFLARRGRLLRTAYLLVGDPDLAEDLVQETAANLYLAWDRLDASGAVDAYARTTLINQARKLWRRPWWRRERTVDIMSEPISGEATCPDPPQAAADPATLPDASEQDALWQMVRELPTRMRAVLVLRYYEDLSEAEIAAVLGVSQGTVKSQASKALAHLRAALPHHPELTRESG